MESIQTTEIDVTTIHDDIGARLRNNTIQCRYVRDFAVSDIDEDGNGTLNIDHRVQFHSALGTTEAGPWKQRQTQIDGRRIQRINSGVEIQSEIRIGIQRAGLFDQAVGKIGIDSPIATLVGVGQRRAFDQGTKTGAIEMSPMRIQTHFDVAQALAMRQLSKGHRQKLFPTGESSKSLVALVTSDTDTEIVV